jgi:hypothetical protein
MALLKACVCALSNMLAIRLYISALTVFFLVVVIANRGLGLLEAIVVTCALVYLILDVRTELHELKSELSMLQDLEQRVCELLSLSS